MIASYGSRFVLLMTFAIGVASAEAPTAFTPDSVFQGSSLADWRTLDGSNWQASNGQIQAVSSGWLVSEREVQDVGFFASFRCATSCTTGVLLRAEQNAEGWTGIYVSLTEGDIATYRVALDENGLELNRETLRAIRGQVRQAPPPAPARSGRNSAAPTVNMGDWNTIQIILDADVIRPVLNGVALPASATEDRSAGFGAVAMRAADGTVFENVSLADLSVRAWPKEQLSQDFRMQQLNDMYYTWSATSADFNNDGTGDIVSGPFVYLGPDLAESREMYLGVAVNPSTEYPMQSMMQFAYDFTGDGWADVLTVGGVRTPALLFVNPQGEARRWDSFAVVPVVRKEIAVLADVDGDGMPEFVYTDGDGLRYAEPDPENPTGEWIVHSISSGALGGHGIGVGDINGDGRMDVVEATTWWEQPADPLQETWIRHDQAFGNGGEIGIFDVNGDGLNDVVTSLEAHRFGLAWYEQTQDSGGIVSFTQHVILTGPGSTANAGDVVFSEPHGTAFADVDGDGIKDFIVGKRFWAHKDSYTDPDPHGAPVLYVYRTVRNPDAPGGAEFIPDLVHNRSGAGNTLFAADIDGDGATDILTATNRGTFVFWGKPPNEELE